MSLAEKINNWAQSNKGSSDIKKHILGSGNNSSTTMTSDTNRKGSITKETALEAGKVFKEMLLDIARQLDVPSTVLFRIESLEFEYDGTKRVGVYQSKKNNIIEIRMSFEDDLFSESLMPQRYDGIDNIIALFNNGYSNGHPADYVYGPWFYSSFVGRGKRIETKEIRSTEVVAGERYKRKNRKLPPGHTYYGSRTSDYIWCRSTKNREALRFMQETKRCFLMLYGDKYNIIDIVLNSDYEN